MEGKKSTQTVGINKIKKEKVSAGKMKKKNMIWKYVIIIRESISCMNEMNNEWMILNIQAKQKRVCEGMKE